MMEAMHIGPRIDRERVALARERLEAFVTRHALGSSLIWSFAPNDSDAGYVCRILAALSYGVEDGLITSEREQQARRIFRRAIGHQHATWLHIDQGRAYAAW